MGVGGPCGNHERARLAQGASGTTYRLNRDSLTPGQPIERAYKQVEHAVLSQPNDPFLMHFTVLHLLYNSVDVSAPLVS